MSTTVGTLGEWFDRGVALGKSHMIVVVDKFDWEDYPVYFPDDRFDTIQEAVAHFNGPNMQKVMEVYNLTMDRAEQLDPGTGPVAQRVWNL